MGRQSSRVVNALARRDDVSGFFVTHQRINATVPEEVPESNLFMDETTVEEMANSVGAVTDRIKQVDADAVLFVADFMDPLSVEVAPVFASLLKDTSARVLHGLAITSRSRGNYSEYEVFNAVYEFSRDFDTTILYNFDQWSGPKGREVDPQKELVERVEDLYEYGLADKTSLQDVSWVGKAGGVVLGRRELDVEVQSSMFSSDTLSVAPTLGDAAEQAVLGKLTASANLDLSARALLVVRSPEEVATDERLYAAAERVADVLSIQEVRVGFVETDSHEGASVTVAVTAEGESHDSESSKDIIETHSEENARADNEQDADIERSED